MSDDEMDYYPNANDDADDRLDELEPAGDGSRSLLLRRASSFCICSRSSRWSLGRRGAAAGVGRHSYRILSVAARLGGQRPCPHPSGLDRHWCFGRDTEISLRPIFTCSNLSTPSRFPLVILVEFHGQIIARRANFTHCCKRLQISYFQ